MKFILDTPETEKKNICVIDSSKHTVMAVFRNNEFVTDDEKLQQRLISLGYNYEGKVTEQIGHEIEEPVEEVIKVKKTRKQK